jgi:hypothetical protein
MKKYAEVQAEKRTPLTGEELKGMEVVLIDGINVAHPASPKREEALKVGVELLAEVNHLRAMMATAYHWIGRPAPKAQATRAYMACIKEARRIYEEVGQ